MAYLSSADRANLDVAIRDAELACRAEISVFVGETHGNPRDHATSLHNTLVAPARSVLVMVDPVRQVVEIVTGARVRQTLTDDEVAVAIAGMTESFAEGDLAGGLTRGVRLLGEQAID